MSTHRLALPALILASIISGTAGTAVKLTLLYFNPPTILFFRLALAALFILLINSLVFHKITFPISKRILLSSFLFTANLIFFTFGISLTTAIAAGFLGSLIPINIALLTHWRRKSEPVSPRQWLGLSLSVIGTIFTIYTPSSFGTILGNLLILGAIVSYSLYQYLNQPLTRKYSPLLLTTNNLLLATFISFPLFFLANKHAPVTISSFSLQSISLLLFLSLIVSVGMYLLYQWGIKHSSSLTAGITMYLSPLVTAAVAIPILGEQLSPRLALGGTLILFGVYLANRRTTLT